MLPLPQVTERPRTRTRHVLPSVLMRSGTSKGLFLHRHSLPPLQSEWSKILLSAMGSQNADNRQIDGVGGATSTTSKVAVISRSTRQGIDVDYTFVQVCVGSEKVDFSGTCGNMASGVAPFALDEGLVRAQPGQAEIEIQIFNTNTSRTIVGTVQVGPDGKFWEDGDFRIGGVKGTASEIKVAFLDPAGSMTEKLFPTGCRQEHITISSIPGIASFNVRASLVDAASPFVFVDSSTMPIIWHEQDGDSAASLDIIEAIRREGAVKMSLARDIHSAGLVRGTPKIAILSPSKYLNDQASEGAVPDISVTSYSMGKVHPSFQVTGAVCLAAAVCVPGTVAADLASTNLFYYSPPDTPPEFSKEGPGLEVCPVDRRVTIAHSTGQISADVKVIRRSDGEVEVQSVSVSRTARRLFKGVVFVSL